MADEQMNYESQDAAPKDTGAEEAYRSLESDDTATQPTQLNPTQVNPAAAHYVQQGAQSTYQAQGGVYGRQGYPQQYQQGQYGQAQYQQGQYQQTQGRPVNPYAQQLQQQQAYQQAQQQRAYQQAQQQAYQQAQQQAQQQSYVPQQPVATTPQKKDRSGLKSALFGLAGGAVGALAVVLALRGMAFATPHVATPTTESAAGQTVTITPKSEDITVSQAVAAKALPSVVSVYVESNEGSGLGSGVILDTDGNILTNWHVAGDATSVSVTIGGKSYDATLVGGDPSSDLAVVHADLQGDTVTPMEIGDSDALVVGDWVMTIGSPFGLDQSVSAGIVSSLARNELMQSTYGTTIYANLIQTDAAINPGNSGGALVNSKGQLVGISTLFSSSTESFAGIGFAIPGNYAVQIANKIISGEQVTHAYIGLSMQTVNAQNAAANNLSVNQGAYVAEVTEGSPAAEAGIQAGDIVIAMGGQQITSADGMILAVRSHSIGETVKVTVMRGNEQLDFDVTLGSDEALQALQQQQYEEQQQQYQQWQEQYQQQYPQGEGDGYGYDNGYGNPNYDDFFEELYEYLYNNSHGGVYGE